MSYNTKYFPFFSVIIKNYKWNNICSFTTQRFITMKKIIILLIFCFFNLFSVKGAAQTIAFKTSAVSFCEKNIKTNNWGKWTEFVKAEIVITIDAKKDLIVVNSQETQAFRINAYYDKYATETQDIVMFDCTDNNGSKCKILVITRKDENNRKQFYINYNEVRFVYNIVETI